MKALIIIFLVLLTLLLSRLWIGTGSYPDRWRTQQRTTIQKSANDKRQEQIDKMQAELNDAKSGKDAIEDRARSELGMTKKGETYFEIILQPTEEESKEDAKQKLRPNTDPVKQVKDKADAK